MDAAAEAGSFNQLRISLSASSESYTGLDAINAVAVIPGIGSEETIVINAHADAYSGIPLIPIPLNWELRKIILGLITDD